MINSTWLTTEPATTETSRCLLAMRDASFAARDRHMTTTANGAVVLGDVVRKGGFRPGLPAWSPPI